MEKIEANLPILSQNLDAHMTPLMEEAQRLPINWVLPYDVGKADERFESMYILSKAKTRDSAVQRRINKEQEKLMRPIFRKIKKAMGKQETADTEKEVMEATKELMELTQKLNKESLMQFQKEMQQQGENK